jgi:hypothetical protein
LNCCSRYGRPVCRVRRYLASSSPSCSGFQGHLRPRCLAGCDTLRPGRRSAGVESLTRGMRTMGTTPFSRPWARALALHGAGATLLPRADDHLWLITACRQPRRTARRDLDQESGVSSDTAGNQAHTDRHKVRFSGGDLGSSLPLPLNLYEWGASRARACSCCSDRRGWAGRSVRPRRHCSAGDVSTTGASVPA